MKYITKQDVYSVIQEPMMRSSIEKQEEILDKLEAGSIDEVCSYIGGRYRCEEIFAEPPIRNGMLQRIITCMVVYRAVRRNAARKVPEDYSEMYQWAFDVLVRIRDGGMPLAGLPEVTDPETGKPASFWGSNRKDEYFF